MKYVRTTILESFRRMLYKDPDNETQYDTEESFLKSLKGEFKGNDKTVIGTAFHKIIEQGESICRIEREEISQPLCPDIVFDGETVSTSPAIVRAVVGINGKKVVFNGRQFDAAIDYRNSLKGVLHELPESKVFPTRYGDLQVSGTADILHGLIIRDVKTRFSALKQQEYMDSFQWRIYLSLFEMSNFAYDVFEFKKYDDMQGTNVTGNAFTAHPTIECAGYSSMEADITALLNDFMEYIKFRELDEYISVPAKKYM